MSVSKRKEIREQRLRRKRKQRQTTIMIMVGAALALVALIALPSIIDAIRPVGEIVDVAPVERPMVDGKALGDPNAPVVVEVFVDFQCPMCRVYSEETETLVVENYVAQGQVYYIFRQYPFLDDRSASRESDQAANASMCAAEQGKFWDYHDILFANWSGENQGAFSDKRLVAFAQNVGLDMGSFEACFEENRYEDQIQEDLTRGVQLGVQGTPSAFVNGVAVNPPYVPSYEDMQQAIEAALAGGG